MITTYTHALHEEVASISGWYELEKEERVIHNGREFVYVIGQTVVDNACCGFTELRYAVVPGFVCDWHSGIDAGGQPTSLVEPITDDTVREQIRHFIEKTEGVSQVQFW